MYQCYFGEIILQIILELNEKVISLHRKSQQGRLADRLGNGLQNRAEQFDSATDLSFMQKPLEVYTFRGFFAKLYFMLGMIFYLISQSGP